MPVKKNENGQRYVEAEVEVPGSPEEVWQAIATGKGMSSWFVPATIEERRGGRTVASFGPGMDAEDTITEWDPPRRYVTGTGAGPENVATEWTVEARSGGRCVVRVVHRWFADSDDWDGQFEAHAYGWATSFFRMLRLYLTRFRGEECSAFDLAAFSASPPPDTWRVVRSALHVDEGAQRVESVRGAPEMSGAIVSTETTDPELLRIRETSPLISATLEGMEGKNPELLIELEKPAPGMAHLFLMPLGEQTLVTIRFYLYGEKGAAVAESAKREWEEWLADRFPAEATA